MAQGVFQLTGIERGETPEAIVRGQAAGQFHEGAQPVFMAVDEVLFHVHKGASSGKERSQDHQQEFIQQMDRPARLAGIGEGREVMGQLAERGGGIMGSHAPHNGPDLGF